MSEDGCSDISWADGRLQISLNGRLAAVGSERDFLFSACRVVLTLVRKSEEVILEKVCFKVI